MKVLLFVAICAATASSSKARLGETLAQCEQRYGPVGEQSNGCYFFSKSGFVIGISFFEGKADRILFRKIASDALGNGEEISDNEIQNFLQANGGGRDWKLQTEISIDRKWVTTDGEFCALYRTSDHGLALITKGFAARQAAEQKAQEDKAQQGF